jgi:cytochrome oxidase assembly protein ShyY1
VYRFLLTPRWLGILALTLAAAAVMVVLGNWQLSRYQERAAINERIDAASARPPVALETVLPTPTAGPGTAGELPPAATAWTRVETTGRFDTDNVILVRNRTVNSRVGFEVVVPLIRGDGNALLVNLGWIPPAAGGAIAQPDLPEIPAGEVTVIGRVHISESQPTPITRRDGRLETRRISVPRLAAELPYPVYGATLLVDEAHPVGDAFTPVPIRHENDWQNLGYVVQWWIFAAMTPVGFGWAARREARERAGIRRRPDEPLASSVETSPAASAAENAAQSTPSK